MAEILAGENARHKQNHCWFQSGIICARLGLTDESAKLLIERFNRRSTRFPTFWDNTPFCQCPDFDHGGAGMVHLQESLMQTSGREIRLLPAWPKDWDVDFKLHAPYNTVVECKYQGGKIVALRVSPAERAADVIMPQTQ